MATKTYLLKDALAGAPPLDTASAFPLTVTHVNTDSSTTLQKTGVTTSTNVMIVVVVAAKTGSGGFPLTLSLPTGISAWTLVQNQGPTTGTNANAQGVYIWYAFSSGGLSNQTITCTAGGGAFFQGGDMTIYSYTSASSTIGNSAGQFFNDATIGHPLGVTITASIGSTLVGGCTLDTNTAQSTLANSTRDASVVDPVFESSATYHLTLPAASAGSVTFGASGNSTSSGPNFASAGVEIRAANPSAAGSLQDGGSITEVNIVTTFFFSSDSFAADDLLLYGSNLSDTTYHTLPTAALAASASDCWRSETTLTGTFAAGTWTFNLRIDDTQFSSGGSFALDFRLWRSVNANGSSPTQITSGIVRGASVTDTTELIDLSATTPSLGSVTLSNEYLFLQVAVSNDGTGFVGNPLTLVVRVGTTVSKLTTTDFAASGGSARLLSLLGVGN